jgi:hypothetical protein
MWPEVVVVYFPKSSYNLTGGTDRIYVQTTAVKLALCRRQPDRALGWWQGSRSCDKRHSSFGTTVELGMFQVQSKSATITLLRGVLISLTVWSMTPIKIRFLPQT